MRAFRPRRLTAVAFLASLALLALALSTCTSSTAKREVVTPVTSAVTPATGAVVTPVTSAVTPVTKVLVFVEENHSLDEMKAQMPYTFNLAKRYGYASNYKAIRHPSLPNYLAIAGGSTFGVTDDAGPSSHHIDASSVFGRAIAVGRTAKTYAEGMGPTCSATNVGKYAVKHNPWVYFTPTVSEREKCLAYDVPETRLAADIKNGTLPTVGLVIPNLCNDAHDCSLATADAWFRSRMVDVLAGPDFKAGRLAVILTADEDDSTQANTVLTMVVHPSLDGLHKVVTTSLTQYSLTRLLQDVAHSKPYLLNAATAPNMATAFGLTIG